MLVTVYSDNLEQISVHLLTDIHHQANRGNSLSLYEASNQRWNKQREKQRGGSGFRGQSQEDTVPTTTQLTVLRPGWVSPLCHPEKDYSVSSPPTTSASTLVWIQPWENSGLHVHVLAHLPHVPIKVILSSKHPKTKDSSHGNVLTMKAARIGFHSTEAQMQDSNSD